MEKKIRSFLLFQVTVLFLLGTMLPFLEDELYYFFLSSHLSLGYFDHPAFSMWLLRMVWEVFGLHWMRIGVWLGWIVSLFFLFYWVRVWVHTKEAWLSVVFFASTFVFQGLGVVWTPATWALAFVLGSFFFFEKKQFLLSGFFLALAGLTKWTAVLWVPYFILRTFTTKRWKGLVQIGVIAILLQFPTLLWNSTHQWVSFRFHLGQRFHAFAFRERKILFCALVFILSGGGLWAGVGIGFWKTFFKKMRFQNARNFILDWKSFWFPAIGTWLFVTVPFWIGAFKGQVRVHWFDSSWLVLSVIAAKLCVQEKISVSFRSLWAASLFFITVMVLLLKFPTFAFLYQQRLWPTSVAYRSSWNLSSSLTAIEQFFQKKAFASSFAPSSGNGIIISNFRLSGKVTQFIPDLSRSSLVTLGNPHQLQIWGNCFAKKIKKVLVIGVARWGLPPPNRICQSLEKNRYWRVFPIQALHQVVTQVFWNWCVPKKRFYCSMQNKSSQILLDRSFFMSMLSGF